MHFCGASIELLTRVQNALLQHQLGQLLKYASSLAREKNVLVQRTMDLTERWNQVTVFNVIHGFSCDALLMSITKSKVVYPISHVINYRINCLILTFGAT